MTPQQLADILIGIAKAQANVLSAIESKLDRTVTHEIRQAVQNLNHAALTQGNQKQPITLQTLPIKLPGASAASSNLMGRVCKVTGSFWWF